jgi:Xaa-Pro aminopeptidase
MSDMHDDRVKRLHERMAEDGVDLAVFSDADSVVYFSGYAN